MKKLVIFDGNSIMNRAFYGVRPLTTRAGLHTNAVYGYINILKKHLDSIKPDYAAVAFDLKAPTFRHKAYDAYKAGRHAMPEELLEQVPLVKEATEKIGLTSLSKEGYEADDILGTVSRAASNSGVFTYVVTGDRDSLQLVRDDTTVIIATVGEDVFYTPEKITEKYSVTPEKLIDIKALMGDSSDNIPGVPGVGEKTAVKLISEFGSLEGVYENLDSKSISAGLRTKLENGKESAEKSRFLAEICLSVPEMPELSRLVVKEIDKADLREFFTRLEFTRMFDKFELSTVEGSESAGQISLFDGGEIAEDTEDSIETIELDGGKAAEFIRGKKDIPLLIDKENGSVYFAAEDKAYVVKENIKAFFSGEDVTFILYTAKPFYHFVAGITGKIPEEKAVAFDAFLSAYLLTGTDNKESIAKLGQIALGKYISPARLNDKAFLVTLLPELAESLKEKLKAEGLDKLYYEIELPLVRVLADMEKKGFLVSKEGLKAYGEVLTERAENIRREIYDYAGEEFNINSPKQLGHILFEKLSLPVLKKNKTGYSTDAETLDRLKYQFPIVTLILEYRHLTKLYGTYIEGLLSAVAEDGRIHTSFNQMLTQTGRLSSNEPNLQNIPIRTETGREFRKFFIAESPDYCLIDADYSQIELRLLAHISGDETLIQAFIDGDDIHTITASEVFGVPIDEVTPEMRKNAKAVNFGIVYGIGAYSLSIDLGVPQKVANEYIKGYFNSYPKVKAYLDNIVREAAEKGYVTTLFGRKRYVPELTATKKTLRAFGERVAMNTPIQGTAADIIKLAMVNVARRLERENLPAKLIMQVHDELIIECKKDHADYVKGLLKEEMENCVSYSVPLTADAGIGKNWHEAH